MSYDYYHVIKRGTTPRTAPSFIEEERDEKLIMFKYKCSVCGWVYDPVIGDTDGGIAPGTPFEKLPDGWKCPVCGAGKADFVKV
jgi:rubredoxin